MMKQARKNLCTSLLTAALLAAGSSALHAAELPEGTVISADNIDQIRNNFV